jgi:hypothetical protein
MLILQHGAPGAKKQRMDAEKLIALESADC